MCAGVSRRSGEADLSYAEDLILSAFRAFRRGSNCEFLRREFANACGRGDSKAYDALRRFVAGLDLGPEIAEPPLFGRFEALRPDERALLTLLGAAQAGDDALFAAQFLLLTGQTAQTEMRRLAGEVVTSLALHGHGLRRPSGPTRAAPARPVAIAEATA